MGVAGDLSTIDLADLFQNIEIHRRTGTLAVGIGDEEARIFFREGALSMLCADRRPDLGELLVAAGLLTRRRLDGARKKGGGSKKTLAEVLVARKAISMKRLKEVATDFLFEDTANLVAEVSGAFEFEDSEDVPDCFDTSEEMLDLAIPVGPLIMEAHRRADHWVLIRKFVPSRNMFFVARHNAICPDDAEDRALGEQILNLLDGTRSVLEVEQRFPTQRFLTNKIIADFVRDRLVRAVEADDLATLAEEYARSDIRRARQFVERGLESEPHHLRLLKSQAEIAETMGDADAAAAAVKLLAHLQIESGQVDEATRNLERAKQLTPNDPAIWERTLALAMQQGHRDVAIAEGMRLVEFHRAPGLHGKAQEVLERLIKLDPDSVDLRIELAHTQVDMGRSPDAVRSLLRWGKHLVGKENYLAARAVYAEILNIEPGNQEGSLSIEMIDKETFARRRERKRRVMRILTLLAGGALFTAFLWFEITARVDYVAAETRVSRERLVEQGRYEEAVTVFQGVAEAHPVSVTALWDVETRIAELRARAAEDGARNSKKGR